MSPTTTSNSTHTDFDNVDELERGDANIPASLSSSSMGTLEPQPNVTTTVMLPGPSAGTASSVPLRTSYSANSTFALAEKKPQPLSPAPPYALDLPASPEKAHLPLPITHSESISESLRQRHLMTSKGAPGKVRRWIEFQFFLTTYRKFHT